MVGGVVGRTGALSLTALHTEGERIMRRTFAIALASLLLSVSSAFAAPDCSKIPVGTSEGGIQT